MEYAQYLEGALVEGKTLDQSLGDVRGDVAMRVRLSGFQRHLVQVCVQLSGQPLLPSLGKRICDPKNEITKAQ